MKRNRITTILYRYYRPAIGIWLLSSLLLLACADDDIITTGNKSDKGAIVSFSVQDAQQNTLTQEGNMETTRAAVAARLHTQGLTPEDLMSRKIAASTTEGLDVCLIESTIEGVKPVKVSPQTRANITSSIDADFSSLGYRGTTSTSISPTPDWFYNVKTSPDGTLASPYYWDWTGNRFGVFYGIYPEATDTYSKLTLSPSTYSGTPYVDFEVETDVTQQKDLMTACSGIVEYTTQGIAPMSTLNFRHALTAIRFAVGQNLSWAKTIDKVEIRNAKNKGRYTLSNNADGTGAAWSNQEGTATFTLSGISVSTSENPNTIIIGKTGDNYTFYMLPQVLTGANITAHIHFTDGKEITATLTGEWKPGTTKTYKISNTSSNWTYHLESVSPDAIAYNHETPDNYGIISYRVDDANNPIIQQPVSWRVVSYEISVDDGATWTPSTTAPSWLPGPNKTQGDGGTAEEKNGTAFSIDIIDKLADRNKQLSKAAAKGTSSDYYDLSTKGGATSRNTANSYVISAPGYYKLPLVYGNAIKNGGTNSSAYQTSNSGQYVLKNFQDHAGKNITDPWITKSNNGENVPNKAEIVWADESGLVTNLSIEGTGENAFLKFQVPEMAIKNGNAVVAAIKDGTVVWSWHLWFAPEDVLNTTTVTNHEGKSYHFTEEPLGFKYTKWETSAFDKPRMVRLHIEQTIGNSGEKQKTVVTVKQNNGGIKEGIATYYQFGRKDAFPGIEAVPQGYFSKIEGAQSISTTIQHPDVLYYNNIQDDWNLHNERYNNLWSINCKTIKTPDDTPVVKTVYDPCPVGFHIPHHKAWTGFTTTGGETSIISQWNIDGEFEYGWKLWTNSTQKTSIFFPTLGLRSNKNGGIIVSRTTDGYYWSVSPIESTAKDFQFKQSYINPEANAQRSCGIPVRPVSE